MAGIAFDDVSSRQSAIATSLTFSKTNTGADVILFVGVDTDADTVTGVTYAGVAMTQVGKVAVPSGGREVYLYVLTGATTGANNVVITSSGSTTIVAYAISYTGARRTGVPDASTTNTGSSVSTLTTSVTTVADNAWTVIFARIGGGSDITGGAGTTVRGNNTNAEQIADSNGALTPAGSKSLILNWASGATDIGAVMASFAPSSGGGAFLFNLM